MNESPSLATTRKSAQVRLRAHSLQPALDADTLLGDLLGMSRAQLFAHDNRILSDAQIEQLEQQIQRIESGEPLAYVLGHQEFWSLQLSINANVLIPRADTELLVEQVLSRLAQKPAAHILELGTGSGAIALALASERPNDHIVATDIRADALAVAKLNQTQLGFTNVTWVQSDWYTQLTNEKFDVIVSNPPYINVHDEHVQDSVRNYEPHIALFAEDLGLAAIRNIVCGAPQYLKQGGALLFEHGWQQQAAATRILGDEGYTDITSYRDLAQHYRVTAGVFNAG